MTFISTTEPANVEITVGTVHVERKWAGQRAPGPGRLRRGVPESRRRSSGGEPPAGGHCRGGQSVRHFGRRATGNWTSHQSIPRPRAARFLGHGDPCSRRRARRPFGVIAMRDGASSMRPRAASLIPWPPLRMRPAKVDRVRRPGTQQFALGISWGLTAENGHRNSCACTGRTAPPDLIFGFEGSSVQAVCDRKKIILTCRGYRLALCCVPAAAPLLEFPASNRYDCFSAISLGSRSRCKRTMGFVRLTSLGTLRPQIDWASARLFPLFGGLSYRSAAREGAGPVKDGAGPRTLQV